MFETDHRSHLHTYMYLLATANAILISQSYFFCRHDAVQSAPLVFTFSAQHLSIAEKRFAVDKHALDIRRVKGKVGARE